MAGFQRVRSYSMFQDVIDGAVLRQFQQEYEAQKKGIVGQITVEIDARVIHVKGYVTGTIL